jgi:hypothetical protein
MVAAVNAQANASTGRRIVDIMADLPENWRR